METHATPTVAVVQTRLGPAWSGLSAAVNVTGGGGAMLTYAARSCLCWSRAEGGEMGREGGEEGRDEQLQRDVDCGEGP